VNDLLVTKSEDVGLIVLAINFQDFQPMWSWSTNVTDGRTDRQTDRRQAITRPRFALLWWVACYGSEKHVSR